MGYYLSCTICTFEREVQTLTTALNLEEIHVDQWGAKHIIEIEHQD